LDAGARCIAAADALFAIGTKLAIRDPYYKLQAKP